MPRSDTCEVEGCDNPAAYIHETTYKPAEDTDKVLAVLKVRPAIVRTSFCSLHSEIVSGDGEIKTRRIPIQQAEV